MRSRAWAAVAASGLLGLLLAGCGTGQAAPSAATLESVPGVGADQAGISVRNAMVPFAAEGYATGADAPLQLSIVNRNPEPVRLVEAAAELVQSVSVDSVVRVGAQPTATEPPTTSTEPPAAGPELVVEAGQLVTATLRLTGLGQPLTGTMAVPVTLTFDNGGVLTLNVPMAAPMEAQPREPMELEEAEH